MKYSDRQRLQKIYDYATQLQTTVKELHITEKELLTTVHLQWLVTTPLYNMGEHASHLSPEFKACHSEIEWTLIAGLRHHLVHDYDGTNWLTITEIIFDDLPVLIEQLEKLKSKNFQDNSITE
ncbi:MAG: DUF86 domain-containing protein [Pyramidobacter sp.]|nr:DUF86 domain-containing protein [Pyramidobacter sp.]